MWKNKILVNFDELVGIVGETERYLLHSMLPYNFLWTSLYS